MKRIFIGVYILLILSLKTLCQPISIPPDKISPIKLLGEYVKIIDTSGKFIKDSYQMNQRYWKIRFDKVTFDKSSLSLNVSGITGFFPDKTDSFQMSNFDIYLGDLKNDTLINLKKLNEPDFFKDGGHFKIKLDLKEYCIIIFSAPHRLPRIYDFSFLKKK